MANKAKYKTLEHNGPLFPPEYECKNWKNHTAILKQLSPLAEEMLWHWGTKRDTDYVKDEVFQKNFWKCFKPELPENLQTLKFPADFKKEIDIIFELNEQLKEEKKQYNKDHKDEIKAKKDAEKAKYGVAYFNGKAQSLGGYLIEGPGIMIARGESPIRGLWKYRVQPEDVEVYCTSNKPIPPAGHNWKYCGPNYDSLATAAYKVDVGHVKFSNKVILFGADSDIKSDADQKKFDKAVKLLQHWNEMEKYIRDNLSNKDKKIAECALVAWLIQTTGIRAGGERDLDIQTDVQGASTLKVKNFTLNGNDLTLCFLGKDSVVYNKTFVVPAYIAIGITRLQKGKDPEDEIFSVNALDINKFLSNFMKGVSCKVFRTAWAAKLIVDEIRSSGIKKTMKLSEKLKIFNEANLVVAQKLNHQRNVAKTFDAQMAKLDENIVKSTDKAKEVEKKAKKDLKEVLKQIEKAKEVWEGEKLNTALARLNEKKNKIKARVEKATARVEDLEYKKDFKGRTANQALGTSKANYLTPELAYSFCVKYDFPIEKIYSKSLQKKFAWAANTSASYFTKFPNV